MHWCEKLDGARRERAGWRADCPVCKSARRLSIQVKGPRPSWNSHCGCDRAEVRARLAELLPGCVSARYQGKHRADPDELLIVILDKSIPPNALRVALLRCFGWNAERIRKELGLPKSTYYDTVRILGRNRRSALVRILGLFRIGELVRILGLHRRSAHRNRDLTWS